MMRKELRLAADTDRVVQAKLWSTAWARETLYAGGGKACERSERGKAKEVRWEGEWGDFLIKH